MTRPPRKSELSEDDADKTLPNTEADENDSSDAISPNPPRTTTGGWFTTPKFGSAGGGGAELEPGPERD